MNKNIQYFAQFSPETNDGGASRNVAFCEHYRNKGAEIYNLHQPNKFLRVLNLFKVLGMLLRSKHKILFFHQGTIMYLFPLALLKFPLISKLVFGLLQKVALKNRLIIEVNDLPYEQAIDLELPVTRVVEHFQDQLYSLKNCYYIFASREMELFVKAKFGIQDTHSEVIVNGADRLEDHKLAKSTFGLPEGKINCVYAGTLNKGRQVESLIAMFSGLKEMNLVLLGDWGEWLLGENLPENVFYLGNKSNGLAQQIVANCDLGLIQYDSSRFYYNLCFPTKISFYLTAGIPVLCTPLKELMFHFKNAKGVFFSEISEWPGFLHTIDDAFLEDMKAEAKAESVAYEWSYLLGRSRLLNAPGLHTI